MLVGSVTYSAEGKPLANAAVLGGLLKLYADLRADRLGQLYYALTALQSGSEKDSKVRQAFHVDLRPQTSFWPAYDGLRYSIGGSSIIHKLVLICAAVGCHKQTTDYVRRK